MPPVPGISQPTPWKPNNGGRRYQGHIAIGVGTGVDTAGTRITGLIGQTISVGENNQHTITATGNNTNAATLNGLLANPSGDNTSSWIAQDGLVEIASGNSSDFLGLVIGDGGAAYHNGTGDITQMYGILGIVNNLSSGNLTLSAGVTSLVLNQGSGTHTNQHGYNLQSYFLGTDTVTTYKGVNIPTPLLTGGSIGTAYGMYISPQSVGTTGITLALGAGKTNTLWVNSESDPTTEAGGIVFGTSKDTNLYRSSANVLKTDDSLIVGASYHIGSSGNKILELSSNRLRVGEQASAGVVLYTNTSSAPLYFGSGLDTNLYRDAADTLKTDDSLVVGGASVTIGTNPAATGVLRIGNNVTARWRNAANSGDVDVIQLTSGNYIQLGGTGAVGTSVAAGSTRTLWVGSLADGTTEAAGIHFGSSADTNLYRSATNTLKTDDTFVAPQIINGVNAISVSSNAGSANIAYRNNNFTNDSASAMTVTIPTSGAVDGQMVVVRIYDASAVAQSITWVNTENSTSTAPVTSNGSTTLPVTAGFQYNSATSKWRCIATA